MHEVTGSSLPSVINMLLRLGLSLHSSCRHTSLPVELFPDQEDAKIVAGEGDLVPATIKVAQQLSKTIMALPTSKELCDALEALCAGDLIPKGEVSVVSVVGVISQGRRCGTWHSHRPLTCCFFEYMYAGGHAAPAEAGW